MRLPRARSPNRDKAYDIFKEHNGDITNRAIAEILNEDEKKIAVWKSRDKWTNVVQQKNKSCTTKKKTTKGSPEKSLPREVESVIENPDLNDKQRLFCLYFIKSFNATRSYQKAYNCSYETAMVEGSNHLRNPKIKDEIMKLKKDRYVRSFISEEDIFQKYWDIAFADITDFISFGRRKVPVMGPFGPLEIEDENGERVQLMKEINAIEFRESTEIDGTILAEVKQGKDGASIKLADRMKALQWLSDHMDLATNEQKVKIDKMKSEIERMNDQSEIFEDDGFIEALQGDMSDVWDESDD